MKQRSRPDIQGLRALAVVLVILFHLPAEISLRGGFVGVDLFFVISGFVVTNMVITAENPAGHAWRSVGAFLRRRIMRLVPVAAVVIAVTILLAIAFAPTAELKQVSTAGLYSSGFLSNVFFAHNFDTYWDPAVLRNPFLHTWSLGVEFQVYLVFPLIFLLLFRGVRNASSSLGGALMVTSVLSAISFIAFFYFLIILVNPVAGFPPASLAFYTPVSRFWEFGLGIICAVVVERQDWATRSSWRAATPIGWLLIVGGVVACAIANQLNLGVVLACLGMVTLLGNGARASGSRPSLLEWKPLVWIGDRSYSIYLWHWPLLVVALWIFPGSIPAAVLSLALTFALSMFTYHFVEQRFRRARGQSTRWALVPCVAFVAIAVLVAGTGDVIARAYWYTTPVPLSRASMDFPDDGPSGADMDAAMKSCDVEALQITCTNFPGAKSIVIIGDSLGYRSMPALQLAAKQNGYNSTIMWTGGCTIDLNSCPSWMYTYLSKTKVAAIVVDVNYARPSTVINANEVLAGVSPICPSSRPVSTCAAHVEDVDAFIKNAGPGLRQLHEFAKKILVALPFPQQNVNVNACLSAPLAERLGKTTPPRDCGRTSVAWQHQRQGLFPAAIKKSTQADPNVTLWDPTALLCTNGECPAVINGGDEIMTDAVHLSWEGSRLVYPAYSSFVLSVKAADSPSR